MTDYQQAAIEAGAREAKERWSMTACTGDDCVVWSGVSKAVIAAAEPHLRKKWAEEIREKVIALSGFHPQVYGERGSGFNDCRSIVLDLLEGADND